MRKLCTLLFILLFVLSMKAQYTAQELRGWHVASDKVGIVEFYPADNPLGIPVIGLYDKSPLLLKFDLFGHEEEQFVYTIELCNSDWKPSDLDVMEYLDGYAENLLSPFSNSFNTSLDYVHYQLNLPNEDVKFLTSGNYIVRISDEESGEVILSRRFVLYEPLVELEAELDRFRADEFSGTQPVNVKIKAETFSYIDLIGNIRLVVQQNGNWNITKSTDRFNTDGNGNIILNQGDVFEFDGMNEYRYFDAKSLKFISGEVAYIEYQPPYHHIYLKPDKLRAGINYFSDVDLNGAFFIRNQESNDDDMLDAEYVYVHFFLNTEIPIASDVAIEGAISDWGVKETSMQFNGETGMYELTLLIKQGIYNYRYVTRDYNSSVIYADITEGNFFQTGNTYHSFLYYRQPGDLHERVIGYGILRTGQDAEEYDKETEPNIIQQLLKEIAPR